MTAFNYFIQNINSRPMVFECHITIDPVFGAARTHVEYLADFCGFKLAKLYMEKDKPSDLDTFMTGHEATYDVMFARMKTLLFNLKQNGYNPRRAKIELICFDTKYGDAMP